MDDDRHSDAPKDDFARFDCGGYEVSTATLTDAEVWERTPPKRRYLLGPDFAERFGNTSVKLAQLEIEK